MELLDINRKVLEVVALTEHELRGHDIVLQTQLDRTLPRVAGDRVQLQQVLLNLVLLALAELRGDSLMLGELGFAPLVTPAPFRPLRRPAWQLVARSAPPPRSTRTHSTIPNRATSSVRLGLG